MSKARALQGGDLPVLLAHAGARSPFLVGRGFTSRATVGSTGQLPESPPLFKT